MLYSFFGRRVPALAIAKDSMTECKYLLAAAYEMRVTHDLLQRGLFTRRIHDGMRALRPGKSLAAERLPRA